MEVGDLAAWAGVVVALAAGVTGLVHGRRAQRTATQAVGEARRANELAEEVQAQQLDDTDVRWRTGFSFGTATWQVTNIGEDTAFAVRVVLTPDLDEPRRAQADAVPHGSAVELDLTDLVSFELRHSDRLRTRAEGHPELSDVTAAKLHISELIRWRTAAGVPRQSHIPSHAVTLDPILFPDVLTAGSAPPPRPPGTHED